jgi:DNA-binding transcriptional ArsR family regulator
LPFLYPLTIPLSKPNHERLGASVFNDPTVSVKGKICYGILLTYVDVNNTCTLTPDILMVEMNASKSAVARAVRSLEQAGIIKRRRVSRTRSEIQYRLLR